MALIHIRLNRYKSKTLLSDIGYFPACERNLRKYCIVYTVFLQRREARVTRYAMHVTSCDISCQRQPSSSSSSCCSVCFQRAVSLRKSLHVQNPSFSLLFAAFYLQHYAFRYTRWVALVCVLVCPQGRLTHFLVQVGFSSSPCSWQQGYCSPWFSSCVFLFSICQANCLSPPTDHHVLRLGVRLYQPNRPV